MRHRRGFTLFICIIAFILAAGAAAGQIAGSGTIQGTITDPTGAVVPQAQIRAINISTGVETMRPANSSGLYVLSPLSPGQYNIRVTAPGFQTLVQERITVDALATIGLDLELKVGSAAETVTVEVAAATIRTEDVALGQTMQNNVYNALPLAMGSGVPRDPTMFISLAPGVAAVVTQSAGPSYTSFNGSQQATNGLYLEGVAMTFPNVQGDTRPLALGVSVEAVEQFQVEINGEKAQYQGQGFHNYQLKSGTNQFHGAVYEYFRNTALDARGFFSPFVPLDHQHEFGANVGGPIKKDKIFFFTNYSGYYFNTSTAPIFIAVPPTAFRTGNFSALPAGVTISDPASTVCNGTVCSKTPFAGNIIPANRISSVAKSFQSYLPNPTNSSITNNYLSTLPRAIHNNNSTSKVDLNLSDKSRFYGVFVRGKWVTDYTGNLTPTGTSLPLPYTQTPGIVEETPTIAQIHHTYVLKTSLLNNFSFAATRLWIPIYSVTADGKYPQKAGLTGLPAYGQAADGFPGINFGGNNAPSAWAGTGPFNEAQNSYTLSNNVQLVHNKHVVTFGFQAQFQQDNDARPTFGTSASFSFSNNDTAGFSPTGTLLTTTGNSYASFLLGAVNSATITDNKVVWAGHRYQDYSGFVQDDWKVTSNLTFNLGLRYDVFKPYTEQYNRVSYMDPDLPNPAAGGRPGALKYGGTIINTHYKNFQPRVGIAYSLNKKTVIRTGFVMAYAHGGSAIGGASAGGPGRTGYNLPASYSSASTGQPAFYWDSGIPTAPVPAFQTPGFGAGFTTTNPTGAVSVPYIDAELAARAPYYMNWSFGLERELSASTTVGATYSASVGHFLPRNGALGIWTNSMPTRYLALGSLLNLQATPANIAAAQAIVPGVALPFSNYQGTIAQMLRPFPQYNGVSCYSCDLGNSNYHSLQVTLNRRFSNGLHSQISYSFSKEIDNMPNGGQLGTVGGTRDPYNGKLDRGIGSIDRRHLFRGLFVYNPPFGKSVGNPVLKAVLSDWSISGLITFSSGAPMAIAGTCNTPGISSSCIPSYNPSFTGQVRINGEYGSGNALPPGQLSYLDKTAFVNPAPYTFGNLPRSAPYGLFAPGIMNEDITVRREFPIRERLRLVIAADVFNITNSVYFAAPGTNIDATNFGQVTTAANSPRKLQLNARITF